MLYPLSYGGGTIILPALAAIGTGLAVPGVRVRVGGLELGPGRANIKNRKTHKPIQER